MRILKENTTLLAIDIQERLFPHIFEYAVLEKNVNILIRGMKILGIPALMTEQYPKGLGYTIPSVLESIGTISPAEKTTFSCCDDPEFMTRLAETGMKNVVIAGIEAHVCVLQTTLDLIEKGFVPIVVEDCVSSRKLHDKNIAIERMRQEGAVITSYESILFELARVSGTDEFKEISRLVK